MRKKIEIGMHESGSMEFWRKFVTDHPDTGHANVGQNSVHELPSEPFFRHFAKNLDFDLDFTGYDISYKTDDEEQRTQHVSVVFDPDADFQYFVATGSTHDGTLYFTYEEIERAVQMVVQAATYYEPYGSHPNGSHITYTVGNFIVITEFGDYGTDEKPWLSQKDTVLLPIRYEREGGERQPTEPDT